MAGQGSARVTLKEIDLSQVRDTEVLPQGVPAAVVGPAKRGPAFVPKTFANMQQFGEVFGSMQEVSKESNANRFAPLALNEWMRNAQAGTFIRTLGVGSAEGRMNSDKTVDGAGFVVGEKVSYDSAGKLQENQSIIVNASNADSTLLASRTYFLGCFMKDTVGSRFLSDAGIQSEDTSASKANLIDVQDAVANGDEFQIFLPKEVVNSVATTKVSDDVTLKIRVVTNVGVTALGGAPFDPDGDGRQTANLEDNLIVINDNPAGATVSDYIKIALNLDVAAGDSSHDYDDEDADGNDVLRFNKLLINPSEIFTATNGVGNSITITLNSTRKEGDEVYFVETAGIAGNLLPDSTNLNEKVFLSGATVAAPVIRGILMTPRGVVASLDLTDANYTPFTTPHTPAGVDNGASLRKFGDGGNNLLGYEIGSVSSSDQSFKVILNGYDGSDSAILDCSFDPEHVNYFANVLNTDPNQIEDRGHYLFAGWDIDKNVAVPSFAGVFKSDGSTPATANEIGFCMHSSGLPRVSATDRPDFESFDTRFRTAHSPWVQSQGFGAGANKEVYDLFKLYALDDGEVANDRFRVLVSNIIAPENNGEWGSFDLSLESFYSDPIKGEALITWKRLSLDPDSKNFIGRVIGDKHMYYDFDRVTSRQRLVEEGDFEVKNNYVRVEVSELVKSKEIPSASLPCGFKSYRTLNTEFEDLFNEQGDDIGANKLLAANIFDGLKVLPLPFVKTITRQSGDAFEASEALAWGVKFAKKQNAADNNELGEIRFNESMKSWTKFFPDMDGDNSFGKDASEGFSLENIVVSDKDNIDWSTSEYARSGSHDTKENIELSSAASVGRNVRYLKFRFMMQGGFDGLDIFNKEKAEMSTIAAHREANDENDNSVFTGATIQTYKRAIDVLADKSATELQLLAIPGMREPAVTDYAITACESRFDAMLVMDVEEIDRANEVIVDSSVKPSVTNIIRNFSNRELDTSFAAAYFPDVIMRRSSNGAPLQVPPSVGMLGVMSLNDTLADPWFAPAGLTRGRINALNAKVQMNRDVLNDLYDADINPIYEPAGRAGEVYAFGQKTLMQNQSALDRINVRRLLINLRRRVKNIANTLLFEPNRASTLARFSALVEPIMAEVQARQGVERYKVQIDTTTTTQNDVENNTIRGKIYLQPTKSVEFISLDFVVTNSID